MNKKSYSLKKELDKIKTDVPEYREGEHLQQAHLNAEEALSKAKVKLEPAEAAFNAAKRVSCRQRSVPESPSKVPGFFVGAPK